MMSINRLLELTNEVASMPDIPPMAKFFAISYLPEAAMIR